MSSIEFAKSMRSVVVNGSPGSISRFEHEGSKSEALETKIVESVRGPSRGDCCRAPDCWGGVWPGSHVACDTVLSSSSIPLK